MFQKKIVMKNYILCFMILFGCFQRSSEILSAKIDAFGNKP